MVAMSPPHRRSTLSRVRFPSKVERDAEQHDDGERDRRGGLLDQRGEREGQQDHDRARDRHAQHQRARSRLAAHPEVGRGHEGEHQ
jgi:hypothetical protein